MAAVICKGIGELCSGLGKVACLPCRACGLACNSFGDVLKSPFFPYLAVTFGLNIPGVVFGIKSLAPGCADLSSWLFANGILCAIHMLAAWYIVNKIRESVHVDDGPSTNDKGEPATNYSNFSMPSREEYGAANSMARIKHVLCYDTTVACYIVVFIGWLIWLSMGVGKRLSAEDAGGCDSDINSVTMAIGCGYMYFSLVFMAFGCSLCCLR